MVPFRSSTHSWALDAYQLDGFDRSERFASLLVEAAALARVRRRRWRHLRNAKHKPSNKSLIFLFESRLPRRFASSRLFIHRSRSRWRTIQRPPGAHLLPSRRLAARNNRVSRSHRHESLVAIALRVARRRGAHDDRSAFTSGVGSRRSV